MFLFKKKDKETELEKSNNKCWRGDDGTIRCLGDECKTECSDKCPIWLNTKGLEYLMFNKPVVALPLFEKAVEMEPEFEGVYNNLAAAYGMNGNYNEAINAYKKKLEFDPLDDDAIYGIAVSYKNLNEYQKALEYCEKYEDTFGSEDRIEKIKAVCLNTDDEESLNPISICMFMLEEDRKEGLIDYHGGFPNIPELIIQKDLVCDEILEQLREYAMEHNNLFPLCGAWCAYAGIGAVYLWNEDWNKLREKGIVSSLASPKGFEELDEYVTMLMGLDFDSEESRTLRGSLAGWGDSLEEELCEEGFDEETFKVFLHAMYMYGLVYGMARLGMH